MRFTLYVLMMALMVALAPACKKKTAYDVNDKQVYPANANKGKLKTEGQYISILYANLFQKALSANELVEVTDVIASVGDKDLVHEVLISNMMNNPSVIIPDDATMRADVPGFIREVYDRFLVREPTEAELTWFTNFINARPNLSAEMVYFAFALSNEYLFY